MVTFCKGNWNKFYKSFKKDFSTFASHSIYFQSIKHRPRCTISVASIVYHVAKLLSCDDRKTFIQTALPYIVQCCLGQQFNARVHNQASEILKQELKYMCIKMYVNKYIFHNFIRFNFFLSIVHFDTIV